MKTEVARTEITYLDPEEIKIGDRIRREASEESINNLAESIERLGQLHPVTVKIDKSGNVSLIAGLRRVLACTKLGIEVKAIVATPRDSLENLTIQLEENIKRCNFDKLEMGEGLKRYKRLYEKKYGVKREWHLNTDEERNTFAHHISRSLHISPGAVWEMLGIANLPEEKKEKIKKKESVKEKNAEAAKALQETRQEKKSKKKKTPESSSETSNPAANISISDEKSSAKKGLAVIGIDLSLRGSGIATIIDSKLISATAWTTKKTTYDEFKDHLSFFKLKCSTDEDRQFRLDLISGALCAEILEAQRRSSSIYVAIEGYAFSKRTQGLSDIHELGGILKGWLWSKGIPFRIYDPLSIKLAWTGSGKAEKEHMVLAAHHKFPQLVSVLENMFKIDEDAAGNIADATLIAALLDEELSVRMKKTKIEKLDKNIKTIFQRKTESHPIEILNRKFICSASVDPDNPFIPAKNLLSSNK